MMNNKEKSMKINNFDMIENFVDYETFTKDSYFQMIINHVQSQYDLMKTGATNESAAKDFLMGMYDGGVETNITQRNRMQDVKLVVPKYF